MVRLATVVIVLLCASSAHAQDALFRASLVSAVVAHSMDLAETQRCLGSGRCTEANPWLARFQSPSGFAIAKMGLASGTLWLTAKLHETHPRWALVANFAQTATFSAIAIRNARVSR